MELCDSEMKRSSAGALAALVSSPQAAAWQEMRPCTDQFITPQADDRNPSPDSAVLPSLMARA
jgi:hypothetical protein